MNFFHHHILDLPYLYCAHTLSLATHLARVASEAAAAAAACGGCSYHHWQLQTPRRV